jgi:hypothetical protein
VLWGGWWGVRRVCVPRWATKRVKRRRSYVGLAALIRAVWLAEQDDGDAWFLV